jgi:mannose-6-phosphate isomerase class I
VFMLNVMDLKPGDAIFLGAGEPHSYISGGIYVVYFDSYIRMLMRN